MPKKLIMKQDRRTYFSSHVFKLGYIPQGVPILITFIDVFSRLMNGIRDKNL